MEPLLDAGLDPCLDPGVLAEAVLDPMDAMPNPPPPEDLYLGPTAGEAASEFREFRESERGRPLSARHDIT